MARACSSATPATTPCAASIPTPRKADFSVQTVAGLPGEAGNVDGVISVAQFNSPLGLTVDAINNGYYIVDLKNN